MMRSREPSAQPCPEPRSPVFIRPGARSRLLPALGLLLYALILAYYMGACAGGPDSSGYLNNARLLGEGRFRAPIRALAEPPPDALPPYTYIPLCFNAAGDGRTMVPTYPMGLPLLIAAAATIAGWHWAPAVVIGLHSLLGLWLMHRLARACGVEPAWAWFGALLLAASPLYLFLSLQAMSDLPAMVWTTAAIGAAWESRARPGLALLAGLALGVAVLVRPTDVLALLPVALALGFSLRRWSALIAGGLPGFLFLILANHAAYGRALTTGYGDMSGLFRLAYVPMTLAHYARWLPVLLTPLVLLGAGLPWVRGRPPGLRAMLAAWALVFPLFYAAYYPTHEWWWYLRFVLPAFPALIAAAVLVAREIVVRTAIPLRGWRLAAVPVLIVASGALWSQHLHANRGGQYEQVYPELAAWMEAHLPANSVVATMQAGGALYYYTPFILIRWDELQPDDFRRVAAACAAAGRPIYAALFPYETQGDYRVRFARALGTHWIPVARVQQASIWRYAPPAAP